MLFWTCPECGRECSPALRECPACPPQPDPHPLDATPGRTESAGGILALAHNLETIHALPLLAPLAEQSIQNVENGRPSHAASTATLVEEVASGPELPVRFVMEEIAAPAEQALLVLAEETLAIPVKQTVDSLVRPLVESVGDPQLPPKDETDFVPEALSTDVPSDVSVAELETPAEPEAVPELSAAVALADYQSSNLEQLVEQVCETASEPAEDRHLELESSIAPPAQLPPAAESASEVASVPEPNVTTASEAHPVEAPEAPEDQSPEPESSIASLTQLPALETLSIAESASEGASVSEPPVITASEAPQVEAAETVEDQSPEPESSIASPAQLPPALETLSIAESASEVSTVSEPNVTTASEAPQVEAAETVEDQSPEPESSIASPAQLPPALETLSIAESASEVSSVSEPNVTTASEAHQVEAAEAAEDQTPEPDALEALSVAKSPSELAAAPELHASELEEAPEQDDRTPEPTVPAPDSVDVRQLALELEPPTQLEALAEALNAVEYELPSESSAAALNQEAALAGTPTAVESLPLLAASEPESAWDPQDARDLDATEALLGALEFHAEALVDAIHCEFEAERAAIGRLAASFQQRCSTALLAAPAEIVTAPAPPVFEWIRTPRPILQPLAPPAGNLVGHSAQPHAPTLAGPCLSPELRNLTELENPKRRRKSRPVPGWMASLLGATLLVLLVVTSLQYFGSKNDAKASTATGSQTAGTANSAGEALSKAVEISGLRLATTWTGKQQVRFLIVNHSDQDLSGVTVQVAVRSSDLASGAAPILLIHAPLRSLGPYQSKEIRTDLDSGMPASALSDWQSLRTEVQVTRNE